MQGTWWLTYPVIYLGTPTLIELQFLQLQSNFWIQILGTVTRWSSGGSIDLVIFINTSFIHLQLSSGMPCSRTLQVYQKKIREKSRECHNHKPQPFPDTKGKKKETKANKHKSNKRTKSSKISSLSPKRGNRNAKRAEKHKNKITQGKT